jgi:hypothetical protein
MFGKIKLSECCISAISGHRKVNLNACHFVKRPTKLAEFYYN